MLVSVGVINIILVLVLYRVWKDRQAEAVRRSRMMVLLESCAESLCMLAGRSVVSPEPPSVAPADAFLQSQIDSMSRDNF